MPRFWPKVEDGADFGRLFLTHLGAFRQDQTARSLFFDRRRKDQHKITIRGKARFIFHGPTFSFGSGCLICSMIDTYCCDCHALPCARAIFSACSSMESPLWVPSTNMYCSSSTTPRMISRNSRVFGWFLHSNHATVFMSSAVKLIADAP